MFNIGVDLPISFCVRKCESIPAWKGSVSSVLLISETANYKALMLFPSPPCQYVV